MPGRREHRPSGLASGRRLAAAPITGLLLASLAWAIAPAKPRAKPPAAAAPARVAAVVLPPQAPSTGPAKKSLLARWHPTVIVSGDFIAGFSVFNPGAGASLGISTPISKHFSVEPEISLNWRSTICELLGVLGCGPAPRPQPPETTITGALIYSFLPAAAVRPFAEAGGGAEYTPNFSPTGWRRVLFFGGGASFPLHILGLRFRPEARIFAEHPLTGTPVQLSLGISRTF